MPECLFLASEFLTSEGNEKIFATKHDFFESLYTFTISVKKTWLTKSNRGHQPSKSSRAVHYRVWDSVRVAQRRVAPTNAGDWQLAA